MSNPNAELTRVVKEGVLPGSVAARYLTMYLGPANWPEHMSSVWTRYQTGDGRVTGDALIDKMRQTISCAVLLPAHDRARLDERPENILHRCSQWEEFRQRDWFGEFQQVVARDVQIVGWRNQALSLGIIDPLEYAPYTRQAFKWLIEKAEASGCVTEETKQDVVLRHTNLVKAYGGACVSSIFAKHAEDLTKVLNWRSGYFFERLIFDIFTPDEVMKIKRAEIAKTNSSLVKRVKVD